jgi:hypothetical protein
MPLSQLGRVLIAAGMLMVVAGVILLLAGRIGLPLGRLPGDITYRGPRFAFFAPLGTSLLLSILLSLILYFISRFRH